MDVISALLLAMSLDVMGRLHKIVYHDLTTTQVDLSTGS